MIARKPRSQTEKRIDAINAGADLLGQVNFTAGKAYYGGEEYILQRGNNRRIIAVSKGAKCSIIDTPFDATEATAEVAAATAILKGLDSKATAEATFNVTQGESIWLFFKLDSTENATVDWGDGTTEAITNYSVYHTYNVSGVVTQKITAPKATKATIAGESRENVLYIGGEITQVTNAHGRTKMVIWGDKVQQFSKGGWGSQIKYKCDIAFPPGATSLYGTWGNNVNYCYIPAICTTISSMQSDTFEQIEIEPSGGELTLSGYYLFGHSGNYAGRTMNSISLPARTKIADKSYLELASGRALKYMRFESGHTTIPSSFMYTANKNYATNTYSKMYVYIPKTVTSIGNSVFASPVHFVYEGTYTEWNAIEKSDGFVTNGGTYELSCKNTPNDGGMRYENFENDIKNAGSKTEINAGNGIEIDGVSNIMSVALSDDSGLSFENGRLKSNGVTGTDDPALQIINGKIRFRGEASGCFNSKDVSKYTAGDGGSYLQELPSDFKIRSSDTIVALVCENRTGTLPSLFALYITPLYKYSSGSQSYMSGGLWYMGNTTDRVISEIDTSDGNLLFKMTGLVSDYDVTWFVKRNSARYNP